MTVAASGTASPSGATVTVTVWARSQRVLPAGMKVSAPDTDTSVPDGTDGVTVTAAVGCVASTTSYVSVTFASVSITATVVVATLPTVTVTPRSSSSAINTLASPTRPTLEVPVTNTCSPSPSSTSSSSGVRANVPVPVLNVPGIVTVNDGGDAVKSVPSSARPPAVPPDTDTVTTVRVTSRAPSNVAVTATTARSPAPSSTDSGSTESVTRASSSTIVNPVPITDRPATVVEPVTRTVSCPSSSSSSIGVRENVAVALCVFSGIVRVNASTTAKSVPDVAVPDSTDTVTSVAEPRVPSFRVPVTTTSCSPKSSSTDS